MEKRIKGAGKLSRKLLTTLVLTGMLTPGFSWAVDNSIYIDQTGDYANITMEQDGSSNTIKGIRAGSPGATTDAAVIKGDGVGINVKQTGNSNTLSLGVDTIKDSATGSAATTIDYQVSGGNNVGIIDLNAAGTVGANVSTSLAITQTQGGNYANVNILGARNASSVTQSGGDARYTTTVNANDTTQAITTSGGTDNRVVTNLTSDRGSVVVSAVGAGNRVEVSQADGGAVGHSASIDIFGSFNSVTTSQSNAIDTAINVKSTGSHNTISVITK
jgi:hypothetical protein